MDESSVRALDPAGDPAPIGRAEIVVVYVEDDARLARLTAQYLATHGIEAHIVDHGGRAVTEVLRVRPDLVLLDLMLPGVEGTEVCRRLRERTDIPILVLTARAEEADKVLSLEGGADDYVVKPFQSRELVARIRAHVRRARGSTGPARETIAIGALRIDVRSRSATLAGEPLVLTTYEFDLLRVLAERAGRVLTREQLLELVSGSSEDAFDRSIDVHVSRLRHKLGDDRRQPRFLKTVRGIGYALAPDTR